ncbi:hypothetical protein GCK72_023131 [Caenorhabditis remanei]|uniref:Zinc finger PHD-type domain-containing protein n=1 Tax=Caenorhabditis remanei TaxID=31234 RepID=A0A6A5FVZ1_CAERE|nr:hypothetical protein GCK72_023131 [Caenorhabditis remanei]KAF1746674.1 hypothetical protein GCK72_023131 [Caenorhabditis remanei]
MSSSKNHEVISLESRRSDSLSSMQFLEWMMELGNSSNNAFILTTRRAMRETYAGMVYIAVAPLSEVLEHPAPNGESNAIRCPIRTEPVFAPNFASVFKPLSTSACYSTTDIPFDSNSQNSTAVSDRSSPSTIPPTTLSKTEVSAPPTPLQPLSPSSFQAPNISPLSPHLGPLTPPPTLDLCSFPTEPVSPTSPIPAPADAILPSSSATSSPPELAPVVGTLPVSSSTSRKLISSTPAVALSTMCSTSSPAQRSSSESSDLVEEGSHPTMSPHLVTLLALPVRATDAISTDDSSNVSNRQINNSNRRANRTPSIDLGRAAHSSGDKTSPTDQRNFAKSSFLDNEHTRLSVSPHLSSDCSAEIGSSARSNSSSHQAPNVSFTDCIPSHADNHSPVSSTSYAAQQNPVVEALVAGELLPKRSTVPVSHLVQQSKTKDVGYPFTPNSPENQASSSSNTPPGSTTPNLISSSSLRKRQHESTLEKESKKKKPIKKYKKKTRKSRKPKKVSSPPAPSSSRVAKSQASVSYLPSSSCSNDEECSTSSDLASRVKLRRQRAIEEQQPKRTPPKKKVRKNVQDKEKCGALPNYCLCVKYEEEEGGLHWVSCDLCREWFHIFCVRLDNINFEKEEPFVCCGERPTKEGRRVMRGAVYDQYQKMHPRPKPY